MRFSFILLSLITIGGIIISGCTNNDQNKKDNQTPNLTIGKEVLFYSLMKQADTATGIYNADFFNGTQFYNLAKNEKDPKIKKELFNESGNFFLNAKISINNAHNYYENATLYANSTDEERYVTLVKEQNENINSITLILINATTEWLKDNPDNSNFDAFERDIASYTDKVNKLDIEKSRLERVINETKQKIMQNSTNSVN